MLLTRFSEVGGLSHQKVRLGYFVELLDSFVVPLEVVNLVLMLVLFVQLLHWLVADQDNLKVFQLKLQYFRLFGLLLLGYLLRQ